MKILCRASELMSVTVSECVLRADYMKCKVCSVIVLFCFTVKPPNSDRIGDRTFGHNLEVISFEGFV